MKIIRFIGKIAALPLALITAVIGFLFNLATNLSGYVIGPAMLLILGFDIWFLVHTTWQHVLILTLLEGCCLLILFGQAAVLEFLLSKREYRQITGEEYKGNIIAYQIRQSFKPGEITPEEANKLGYELAMRFTKGQHAFTVSTHTDKAHIHNHIIFNSTTLSCDHKFKNFFFSGLALQRLSDIICFEHGYSIIEKKPYAER